MNMGREMISNIKLCGKKFVGKCRILVAISAIQDARVVLHDLNW